MVIYKTRFLTEKFEDAKRVIRSHKSKEDRKYHGQKKKDKPIYKALHRKLLDRTTWTPLKTRCELMCSGRVNSNPWYPLCYSCYKPGDKSRMRKWQDGDCYTRNISMVICDKLRNGQQSCGPRLSLPLRSFTGDNSKTFEVITPI
jgi:hypothetical protein